MKKLIFTGFLLGLIIPSLSFAAFDSSLKYGAKGSAVTELQEFLADQNVYSGPITGNFFALTLKAVKAWQTANELPVTGFFGTLSRAKASEVISLADSDNAEVKETGTLSINSSVEGCISVDGFSVLTGKKCDGTTPTSLDSLQTSLNQIVQNTTPPQPVNQTPPVVPISEVPVPVIAPTPTEPTDTFECDSFGRCYNYFSKPIAITKLSYDVSDIRPSEFVNGTTCRVSTRYEENNNVVLTKKITNTQDHNTQIYDSKMWDVVDQTTDILIEIPAKKYALIFSECSPSGKMLLYLDKSSLTWHLMD